MKLIPFLLTCTCCMQATAQTATWTFSENSTGGNINWTSPTAVSTQADQYDWDYDLTYIAIDLVFFGQIIGPNDITGEIDPKLRHGEGLEDAPLPILLANSYIEADGDADGTTDLAGNIFMQINEDGQGQLDVTKVFLGTIWVDTGYPFYWQELEIDRIYFDGVMHVTEIVAPCPEDTNGDDLVNVTDILTAIGNWGGSGDGDVDGDGVVNVSDILAIVGAWGPCFS